MSKVLAVRIPVELHETIMGLGGSGWAGPVLARAVAELRPAEIVALADCPRAERHRDGVVCPVCKQTPGQLAIAS